MIKLIEIVPNFSEGRRPEVVEEITGVLKNIDNTWLLDSELDPDHNRCVVTVIVTPESLIEAGVAMLGKAIEHIDLNNHEGQHPRMGACDVFPLIPLSGVTTAEAVELCKQLGAKLAETYNLPSYLYEDAASIPWRRNLARIRYSGALVEGGEKVPAFEWLRENISKEPNLRKPDFEPAGVHPTAGITAISTRFFLVAYNVNLETTNLKIAEGIAEKIRERSGGFPAVKALGFELKDKNCVQVSMNLVDYRESGIDKVYREIEKLANESGVAVRESELIGLVPQNAIDKTVMNYLGVDAESALITQEPGILPSIAYPVNKLSSKTEKFKSQKLQLMQVFEFDNMDVLEDFAKIEGLGGGRLMNAISQDVVNELFRRLIKLPELDADQIIENSVENTTGIAIPTITFENPYNSYKPFIDLLASEKPAPGGGSVAALVGALAAALGEMVSNLTRSKKKYLDNWEETGKILADLNKQREYMLKQVVDDAESYNMVAAAMKHPKKTDAEKAERMIKYQEALKVAIQTPFETAKSAVNIAERLEDLCNYGAPSAITDIGVGALLCKSAYEGAIYNVRINLLDLEDAEYRTGILASIDEMRNRLDKHCEAIKQNVENNF